MRADRRRSRERPLELAAPDVAQPPADRLRRVDVHHEQRLLEPGGARDDLSLVVEHDGVAVEDELVLPADEIAERDVRRVVTRARDEHLLAVLRLPDVEGRRAQVDEQRRAGQREVGRGWPRLPDVLADRRPDEHVAHLEQQQLAPGREVAVLVEDAVVREEVLAIDALDRPLCADEGGVREIAVERRRAHQRDRVGARARDLVDGLARCTHEAGPEQQVLGRVARDGELGEDDEVCRRALRLRHRGHDPLDVPLQVADDGVQLRERDPHAGILHTGKAAAVGSFCLMVTNVTVPTR